MVAKGPDPLACVVGWPVKHSRPPVIHGSGCGLGLAAIMSSAGRACSGPAFFASLPRGAMSAAMSPCRTRLPSRRLRTWSRRRAPSALSTRFGSRRVSSAPIPMDWVPRQSDRGAG